MLDVTHVDLGGRLPDSLPVPIVLHEDSGVLAAAAPTPGGQVVVVGWWMAPDFFRGVSDITAGSGRYRQLGLVVALQRNYVWLLVAGLVVALALLALLLSVLLARGMARPLADLSAALERVAAEDLTARVRPSGARELRTLGESFNTMAERMATAREAVRRSEREATWRQVARYLAHEINNMLSPIGSAAFRIEKRLEGFPEAHRPAVQESLDLMRQSLDDLGRLAEQFSQFARLPEPRLEPVDLIEIVRAAAQLERSATMELTAPDRPLAIRADRMLISRALHNLLVNAREAAPEGSAVEVRVASRDGVAEVEVLDRGPGIDPELRARVFDPFVSTKQRGSGLGLSLVRDIMTQHGGEVSLDNREGGGACARIRFPLAGPDTEALTE
jgi:nitrogen fixation/metabolism regulation signal transduction histidine kinase